ncbi:MAG TPA: ABC transporter permease [Candidatus Acidoferrum sp.]|nr:ABC transporter permease [Candidatus Acidoferrum sp.]
MGTLLQDLRYGVRTFVKRPGFAAVAILTLALGIGANTAIFTVINSVLLSSLPVKAPEQLVFLSDPDSHGMSIGSNDGDRSLLTYAEFQDLSARNQVFSGLLAADSSVPRLPVSLEGASQNGEGSPAFVNLVSGSYFSVLGVDPVLGHAFGTEVDKTRDANPVAVISYSFWQGRFGGDSSVLGRKIRIRDTSYDIIGVMPQSFFGETVGFAPDVWVPLTMQAEVLPGRDFLSTEKNPIEKTMWLAVIGRLKPSVTVEQAKASANVTFQSYLQSQIGSQMSDKDRRDFLNQHLAVVEGSHGSSTLRGRFAQPLIILMAVVGLVLLIACANVANLLLARAASREKEIAVRISLGAGRARLFRQMVTESILLAAAGGVIGLLLAQWADAVLLGLVSQRGRTVPLDLHPDARILGFTLGVSLFTGVLFGFAPAFRASRVDINSIMKSNSRGVIGGAGAGLFSMGKILVIAQVALSLLLLVIAGLFVRSFQKLSDVQLGYDRDHLLLFSVAPLENGYTLGAPITQLYKDLLERIAAVPGVRGVTFSQNGLFSHSESDDPISIEGFTPKSGQDMESRFDQVGPNYFSTIGIPILLGREIGLQDSGNGQRVGVINQTMAKYYFGDSNPIGRRIWDEFPTNRVNFVVVGVAADAKYNSIREKTPRRFYVPFFNSVEPDVSFARIEVRASGNPSTIAASLRDAVKQTAPNLPPIQIDTMNELVADSLTQDTMLTKLSGFFGVLAVLLACIGIYGIMAYAVANRTSEIGIRMALGAQRGNVLGLILRESMLLALIGVLIGLPAVFAVWKLIKSLLYGLTPADPLALAGATLLMFVVAAVAGYIPARRASKTDPIEALRYE